MSTPQTLTPPTLQISTAGAATNSGEDDNLNFASNVSDDNNGVVKCLAPSHILEDGRFVYLPPPNVVEKSRYFERSIARHGLLEADMTKEQQQSSTTTPATTADTTDPTSVNSQQPQQDEDKTAPKVHPLAVASAKLQASGLAELNRAINLAQLVSTGEYFGLSNVIDPTLEGRGTNQSSAEESKSGTGASVSMQQVDAVKSTFVLKRKRSQFQKATVVLARHEKRLKAAIQAQSVLDRRLFQLRQQWRLVAPEHGTRARLHAARPTEVVAIDVDVYDRDRVGGGNQALKGSSLGQRQTLAGRLASRVPRFATIELKDDFKVVDENTKSTNEENGELDMEVDEVSESKFEEKGIDQDLAKFTRAEPFAVADPTLGRVVENFDPSKVPMLNLQLDIQKSSTGFLQSCCLEPMTTLGVARGETTEYSQDEELLVTLQHSLFCASLFESIRSELDPPSDQNPTQFSPLQRNLPTVAWLSCESEQNFLPPPNRLVGGRYGLTPLSVVHCHEGEVKVQLDSEYTLGIKLVEANVETEQTTTNPPTLSESDIHNNKSTADVSGSQTPKQLHALCRSLLLHAQDVYHRHSLYLREREKQKALEEKAKGEEPRGLARITKEDIPDKAWILQSCVSLGAKMLFEKRVRKTLIRLSTWLKHRTHEKLEVDWLALSVFELESHFTLAFRHLVLDVNIARDGMTVTRIDEEGSHRKTHFHSEQEFEIFTRMELQRQLKNQPTEEKSAKIGL